MFPAPSPVGQGAFLCPQTINTMQNELHSRILPRHVRRLCALVVSFASALIGAAQTNGNANLVSPGGFAGDANHTGGVTGVATVGLRSDGKVGWQVTAAFYLTGAGQSMSNAGRVTFSIQGANSAGVTTGVTVSSQVDSWTASQRSGGTSKTFTGNGTIDLTGGYALLTLSASSSNTTVYPSTAGTALVKLVAWRRITFPYTATSSGYYGLVSSSGDGEVYDTFYLAAGASHTFTMLVASDDSSTWSVTQMDTNPAHYPDGYAGQEYSDGVNSWYTGFINTPVGSAQGYSDGTDVDLGGAANSDTPPGAAIKQTEISGPASPADQASGRPAGGPDVTISNTSDSGALTNGVYMTGVQGVVTAINRVETAVRAGGGSSGGGGSTDMTATNTKLDTISGKLTALDGVAGGIGTGITGYGAGDDALGDASSRGAAAAAGSGKYDGPLPTGTPGATVASSFVGTLGTASIGGHDVTLSLIPSAQWSDADSLLKGARPLLLWAACVAAAYQLGKVAADFVIGLSQVNAATVGVGPENMAPGVVQGKIWGAAGLITVAVAGGAALLVGVVDTVMGSMGVNFVGMLGPKDLSSVGGGLALLSQYVPLASLLVLWMLRTAAPYLMMPIYVGVSATIRFFGV